MTSASCFDESPPFASDGLLSGICNANNVFLAVLSEHPYASPSSFNDMPERYESANSDLSSGTILSAKDFLLLGPEVLPVCLFLLSR